MPAGQAHATRDTGARWASVNPYVCATRSTSEDDDQFVPVAYYENVFAATGFQNATLKLTLTAPFFVI